MEIVSSTIEVVTRDGRAEAFVAHPDDGLAHPGVLVYMDAFGLRERLSDMARHVASRGYFVMVPNVFYRNGRAPLVDLTDLTDLGNPASRGALLETLKPLLKSMTPASAACDADAYLAFLASCEDVTDGPVGIVGYCMGGALALRAAARCPGRVAAVASFHGGNLASESPDSSHLSLDRVAAEVYVGHADQDQSMPPEQIDRLDDALAASGLRYRTEVYAGASHGFTMSDTAAWDEAATERHWDRLFDLLDRTLLHRL